ncbi:uncharacterized protein LOC143026857 [Oratosquilla oratoria]|uniref:uncharacterized protein LOC143026857 n=1 Tax=Oratosquilla oratoria TaxID=337810 RepID=UPI003F7687DB
MSTTLHRTYSCRRRRSTPLSDDHRYLFTTINRSIRWLEAIPMKDITASSCTTAFLSGCICRFGLPEHVTSYRGTCFISRLWQSLAEPLGTTAHHTTSYNPAANGMLERGRRSLKASLIARCNNGSWLPQLPWILLGLQIAIKDDLSVFPTGIVLGQPLVMPAEFFLPQDSPASL